jgi:diadenosine tetraphosphatase ApaH/serine/threonine PP2A family protein phosphatase
VLAEADAASVDEVWCLGDVVGYGPRPNECVALLRERTALCLAGNHDLVVLGKIPVAAFAGEAGAAAVWTQRVLDDGARAFLGGLRPQARREHVALYHGSPSDPVWDYVTDVGAARRSFRATDEPLILVGHSHVALQYVEDGGGTTMPAGTTVELGPSRRLLNPGSVGQPRDGDPRAAWLEIDNASGWATFRRTEYPVERTQSEMREAGLPEVLAARLEHGV